MIRDKLSSLKNRLDALDEQFEEKKVDTWRKAADVDEEKMKSVIAGASGDSVSFEALIFPIAHVDNTVSFELLDDDEQPHYFLKGSTIDVEGQGSGTESIVGWDRDRRIGGAYTVLTEDRVLIIANHARGYDEHTIPYDTITTTNLNNGFATTRLSIQTKSATYHCGVSKTEKKYGKDEVKDAVKYLRQRREQGAEPTMEGEPLDKLEQLKSLYDDGTITEEEFEEQKAALLDDL